MEDKPIARVFDKLIYPSDVLPIKEVLDRYHAQLSPDKFIEWENKYRMNALESLIYLELQNKFLEKTNMNPTDEEIQSHIDFSAKADKERMGIFEAQRNDVLTQLGSPGLTDAERKPLNDHLKILDQLIDTQKQRKEEEKSIPNYDEIKMKSLKNVASSMVKTWKFNTALYNAYGGRVIFQQFGWEPIDAYKMFLDEHKEAKTFEVFDPSFDQIFNDMYNYFEMGHSYMTKENADKYFSKPWWDPTFEPL